ncbi:MAG: hypothetical protein CFH01_00583 [Alphaproteobacteria bacterium MarineAlpha2_Bin1]|nr:MAG: hypothetical protein CFH01_00583 [Alphaproteobacteria bacterium MarineAlpha2_Bin1]|tara:strand:- start:134 stop:580 length:447 start_codon:yes stop_codon:yes gene_type:complete
MKSSIFLVLAVLGGSLIPFQAAINSILAKNFGNPFLAALTSTFISFSSLLIIILVTRQQVGFSINTNWWVLIGGGIIGAFVVFISLSSAPILGVSTLFAALFLGQLLASILIDHFGILGLQTRAIDLSKVLGIIFLFLGFYLVRKSSI